MIRDWFKGILTELFDERIDRMASDYVEKKVGATIEAEIQGALEPSIKQIKAMNADIKKQLTSIREAFDADVKLINKTVNESVQDVLSTLPEKMGEIEVDLGNINDDINQKVKEILEKEIWKTSYNPLVDPVRSQFSDFCGNYDFMASLKKDSE